MKLWMDGGGWAMSYTKLPASHVCLGRGPMLAVSWHCCPDPLLRGSLCGLGLFTAQSPGSQESRRTGQKLHLFS